MHRIAVALLDIGPAGNPVLHPQGHYARSIFELSSGVLWVCLAIFLLVAGLVTYAGWKFRARPDEADPKQIFGSTKWEMAYVILPTIVLAVIFVFMLHVMHTSDPPAQASGDDIVVVGHQWWWEVRYPKLGFRTANEIHIPAGVNLQFGFESADVIHDFWVPELGRKIVVVMRRSGSLRIIPAPISGRARSSAAKSTRGCASV